MDKCAELLERARVYVQEAQIEAENKHDDMEGEYYMDYQQYEKMNVASQLLKEIDDYLLRSD